MVKYTASIQSSLIKILEKIDDSPFTQTVFILDNKKVVGTITDGDIRRGFIKGFSLSDPIIKFINNNFLFIEEGKNNFDKLKSHDSLNFYPGVIDYLEEKSFRYKGFCLLGTVISLSLYSLYIREI